ncbi:MAG: RNA polymerase subunit sigma-70 [Chloroflexi bacterium]|nr:MAG: RNA polymerase subunit sigma-70 [Chloroflexota bacterium]
MDADLPLLEAIRTGDEPALELLMERHQAPLFYFVLRYCGNELEAREVVQETFVRAFFKAGSFQPRSKVKTWLFTIALNLCRDAGRRRSRAPSFVSFDQPTSEGKPPLDVTDEGVTADERASRAEELSHLRQAIDKLPEKLKVPLVLCVLEQRSHKEAADLLSTTPKTIELRIYRAKKKLRDMMEDMHSTS